MKGFVENMSENKKSSKRGLQARTLVACAFAVIAMVLTIKTVSSSSVVKMSADDTGLARAEATFTNPAPITIPSQGNGNPYPSEITVAGLGGNIVPSGGGVNVTLNNFTHDFPSDVGIALVGPTGA